MRWLGDLFFHALGYPGKATGAGGIPPTPAPDGQWDFSDAAQSGHFTTIGF